MRNTTSSEQFIPSKVISVNGVTGDAQAMVREIKVRDDQLQSLSDFFGQGQMGKKNMLKPLGWIKQVFDKFGYGLVILELLKINENHLLFAYWEIHYLGNL